MTTKKMKVEIWSDVTCAFCFTAKRKFEKALANFKYSNHVEVIWRSFELAPNLRTNPKKYFPQFLAELQGISIEQSTAMIEALSNSVKEVGLEFNLRTAIPANSFNAHRLSHLAKHNNKQDQAEESLFQAYFNRGLNIDAFPVLIQLGNEIGLDPTLVQTMLQGSDYTDEVRQDIYEAKQVGITSVPFFRFNGKTSVSGAQDSSFFLEILEKTYAQWQPENVHSQSEIMAGKTCNTEGGCSEN